MNKIEAWLTKQSVGNIVGRSGIEHWLNGYLATRKLVECSACSRIREACDVTTRAHAWNVPVMNDSPCAWI